MVGGMAEFNECFSDADAIGGTFFQPFFDLCVVEDALGNEDFTDFLATSCHGCTDPCALGGVAGLNEHHYRVVQADTGAEFGINPAQLGQCCDNDSGLMPNF